MRCTCTADGVRSGDWAGSLAERKYGFFLGASGLCPEHVVKVDIVVSWWGEELPEKDRGGSVSDSVHAGRDLPQQSRRALGRWVHA